MTYTSTARAAAGMTRENARAPSRAADQIARRLAVAREPHRAHARFAPTSLQTSVQRWSPTRQRLAPELATAPQTNREPEAKLETASTPGTKSSGSKSR